MPAHLFLSVAIVGITLLSWLSQVHGQSWVLDLASSFQMQYAIANLLLWLLLLGLRLQRRKVIYAGLLLGLACISVQMAMLGSWSRPAMVVPPNSSVQAIKILSSNVHPGMEDYGPLLGLIEQEQPDFVLLQEATALSLEQLGRLKNLLPYSLDKVPPGDRQPGEKYPPKGTALFSRFPLTGIASTPNSPEDRAGLLAEVQTKVQTNTPSADAARPWLRIFVVHALVPIRPNFYRQRNDQLAAVFAAAQTSDLPSVAMGDFNTSLWSSQLSTTATAPLRSARQGFGIQPSWRPNLAFPRGWQWLGNLFWTPIDHSYVSPDIAIQDFRLGADVKSDHLPIIVELEIPNR